MSIPGRDADAALSVVVDSVTAALRGYALACAADPNDPVAIIAAGGALRSAVLDYEEYIFATTLWSTPLRHLGPMPPHYGDYNMLPNSPISECHVRVVATYELDVFDIHLVKNLVEGRGGDRPATIAEAVRFLIESDGWQPTQYPLNLLRLRSIEIDIEANQANQADAAAPSTSKVNFWSPRPVSIPDRDAEADLSAVIDSVAAELRGYALTCAADPWNPVDVAAASQALKAAVLAYEQQVFETTGWSNPIRRLAPSVPHSRGLVALPKDLTLESHVRVVATYELDVLEVHGVEDLVEGRSGDRPTSIADGVRYLVESDGWLPAQYPDDCLWVRETDINVEST